MSRSSVVGRFLVGRRAPFADCSMSAQDGHDETTTTGDAGEEIMNTNKTKTTMTIAMTVAAAAMLGAAPAHADKLCTFDGQITFEKKVLSVKHFVHYSTAQVGVACFGTIRVKFKKG